jgi:zinc transporter
MIQLRGILFAHLFAPDNTPQRATWREIETWQPDHGFLWAHLVLNDNHVRDWLENSAGLPALIPEALLDRTTRPRLLVREGGVLVILHGVNVDRQSDPGDTVVLHLWCEAKRVISLRQHRVTAAQLAEDQLLRGEIPATAGAVLTAVAHALIKQLEPLLIDLREAVDRVEEALLKQDRTNLRSKLSQLRRQVIVLRRHMAPQRDVLHHLCALRLPWLGSEEQAQFVEIVDDFMRHLEDLDSLRDHMVVVDGELTARQADQLNQGMYRLTLMTAIFLPLTFLTGLLGINVAGIPGADNHVAFLVVCAVLGLITVVEIWLFFKMKWL